MKYLKRLSTVLVMALCVMASCNRDEDDFNATAQYNKEVAAIDEFLDANFPDHIKDPSGIRIVITELGAGLPGQILSLVNVDYKGTLFSDGTVFDEGTVNGQLIGYITGWQYAFTILPVGSKAKLYIPSALAYGRAGSGKVPANATLVFEVNFKDIDYSPLYNQKFTADTDAIADYIESNTIEATQDVNGFWTSLIQAGSGPMSTLYNEVDLKLTFYLLQNPTQSLGTIELLSNEERIVRPVDQIQGIAQTLRSMNEGAKVRAYIPSGLGFGIYSYTVNGNRIPENSNIIVDIELLNIHP